MNNLPAPYLVQMKNMLQEDYDDFIATYSKESCRGFRINDLKISVNEFKARFSSVLGFAPTQIPWCNNGYYYPTEHLLSKTSLYHAGLFYIQEPSAMSPVEFLDIQPGMKVLDLCAAPGGKTIQIAGKLQSDGLLVSNDSSLKRSRAILKNIELFGVKNAVVTNSTPEQLSKNFSGYFDRILVDAPCSGEGMFRKEPDLIKAYDAVLRDITEIQAEILSESAKMLKPSGIIIYSTCTFNQTENEQVIIDFLRKYPEFKVIDPFEKYPALPLWGFQKGFGIPSVRLFPHKLHGEGHFFAILEKSDFEILDDKNTAHSKPTNRTNLSTNSQHRATDEKRHNNSILQSWKSFLQNHSNCKEHGIDMDSITIQDNSLYYEILQDKEKLSGIRVLRNGLYLGDFHKKDFIPSSALIMASGEDFFKNRIVLSANDPVLYKYLRCETLHFDLPDGLYFIHLEKFPIGAVKIQNEQAKNLYNKNWRLL